MLLVPCNSPVLLDQIGVISRPVTPLFPHRALKQLLSAIIVPQEAPMPKATNPPDRDNRHPEEKKPSFSSTCSIFAAESLDDEVSYQSQGSLE